MLVSRLVAALIPALAVQATPAPAPIQAVAYNQPNHIGTPLYIDNKKCHDLEKELPGKLRALYINFGVCSLYTDKDCKVAKQDFTENQFWDESNAFQGSLKCDGVVP